MSIRQQQRSGSTAFTLLEVMLAVTILGLVMTALYATWSAGLNGWKRTAGVSENFQRERVVMGTLADLTKSLVFAQSKPAGLYSIKHEHNAQTGDSLSFVTSSDALLPATEASLAGLRRVTISLDRDGRGRSFLGIMNTPALTADDAKVPAPHVLSAEVCGFAVRFRNPTTGIWEDKWEEETSIPSAIEFTVGFGKNDGRTPPVVVTRSVELPIAQYVLQALGQTVSQQDTTNSDSPPPLKLIPGKEETE